MAVYDPNVRNGENTLVPDGVQVATDVLTATTGTQAAVVVTEWSEIVDADWAAISRNMVTSRFVFDGRNALDPLNMSAAGFEHADVGRIGKLRNVMHGRQNDKCNEDTECQM